MKEMFKIKKIKTIDGEPQTLEEKIEIVKNKVNEIIDYLEKHPFYK